MDNDFINLFRGLVAAVIIKAIEDYRMSVSYLYRHSGATKLTVKQKRSMYEAVRSAQECELAIVDMARSILGYDSTEFMERLKKELYERYEQQQKEIQQKNQQDHH